MAIGPPPGGIGFRGMEGLPDPFMDIASLTMPTTMIDALRWCERVYERMGVYRAGIERIIAYFITQVTIEGDDRAEKKKYEEYLRDELDINSILMDASLDSFFLGNGMFSMIVPIKRYLACPTCGLERTLSFIDKHRGDFAYSWENFGFWCRCPKCHNHAEWKPVDRKSADKSLIFKRWNPYEMEIIFDYLTEQCSYVWKIPSDYRDQIRRGDMCVLETANWEIIQAVKKNQWLRFEDGFVYHMKERKLGSQINRGWGISKVLANFGIAYYVQMLHKYNEALALDYVIPFRVLTPDPSGAPIGAEKAVEMGMSTFTTRANSMIRARRNDPTRWNVLPFPVKYQALGGDASQFCPKDLIDQGYDVLLNSIGCPVELYKGTLSTQAVVPAIRLFESHHSSFRGQLGGLLRFICQAIADRKQWQPVKPSLDKPTVADDVVRQQTILQLGMNRLISQTTALRPMGLDYEEEQRKLLEEQKFLAEETAKMQEQQEQSAASQQVAPPVGATALAQQGGQGGAPGATPPGGAAPAGAAGGADPRTPEEFQSKAEGLAQQLIVLDETSRKSQLSQLKAENPILQRLVVSALADLRSAAATQGQAQVLQQQGAPQQ